jgi:hypothetical protein
MKIPSVAAVVPPAPISVTPPVHTDTSSLVRANFRAGSTADAQPCNWQLTAVPDSDQVTAVNSVSGSTFEGTVAEFNAALKGL